MVYVLRDIVLGISYNHMVEHVAMTNEMKGIIERLGELIIARKPEIETAWKQLLINQSGPAIADFLDEHFPIHGSWGIQGVRETPNKLEREYPLS